MKHFSNPKKSNSFASGLSVFKPRMAVIALTIAALSPLSAQAWCGVCAPIASQISTLGSTILQAISQSTTTITMAIEQSTFQIKLAIQSSAESLVGSNEKNSQAAKELEQAGLNYKAAMATQEAYAAAQEKFVIPESQAYKKCELLEQASQTNDAQTNAKVAAKARTASHAKRNLYSENALGEGRKVLQNYKDNYCSEKDKERGRCDKVAPVLLQGAPTRADILLAPTTNNTYTKEESEAASAFITMVTGPMPIEALPKGFEKSPGADRFNIEQMHVAAQLSVAQHSLEQIKASKETSEANAGVATANGFNASVSLAGLMEKFVKDKFGNADYAKDLNSKNENGLLKELNVQMAFSNWMSYQSYTQNERIETLIATQLATAARERADRQLAMARSLVGKAR